MNNNEKLILSIIKKYNNCKQRDVGYFLLHKISYLIDITYNALYGQKYSDSIYTYKGLGAYNETLKDTLKSLKDKNCIYEDVINNEKAIVPIHLFYLENDCDIKIDKEIDKILDKYINLSYNEIIDIVYSTIYMKISYPGDKLI